MKTLMQLFCETRSWRKVDILFSINSCWLNIALGPAYNKFGHNEHPTITSRFLYIKII